MPFAGRFPYTELSVERMLQFFAFAHLREDLKAASQPFAALAERVVNTVPAGAERTVGLRKLLEAKDAILRAVALPDQPD